MHEDRRALAVVHAGWRGLVSGILPEAIRHFATAGFPPSEIRAWVAPAIAMPSYEVGPEVGEHAPDCARERGREDRWQVDIGLWAEDSLRQLGIASEHLLRAGLDTGQDQRLFSHRRQGVGAGRNGLFAVLAD
jgi:copper oxidase (laccase) domain-containing protein